MIEIATCGLRIESQSACCRFWDLNRILRRTSDQTYSYMIVRQVHFASPLPFPLLKGSTRAGYQTSFGGEIEFQ